MGCEMISPKFPLAILGAAIVAIGGWACGSDDSHSINEPTVAEPESIQETRSETTFESREAEELDDGEQRWEEAVKDEVLKETKLDSLPTHSGPQIGEPLAGYVASASAETVPQIELESTGRSRDVERYWTEERMKEAQPLPIPGHSEALPSSPVGSGRTSQQDSEEAETGDEPPPPCERRQTESWYVSGSNDRLLGVMVWK